MDSKIRNTLSKKFLKIQTLRAYNYDRITISFYKYFNIKDPKKIKDSIYYHFFQWNVFGRIYVSKEGINAQLSVPYRKFNTVKRFIYKLSSKLLNIYINLALDNKRMSFWMLKVKIRKKIVEDGMYFFNTMQYSADTYLSASQVNKLINNDNVTFVDVRNNYEYAVGHFKNSIRIPGETFKEQIYNSVPFLSSIKDKTIVLYCTGGIRCEKTAFWLKTNGFKKIYQILGGILRYVKDARRKHISINFIGSNFVFDERMTEMVSKHIISYCYNCNSLNNNYKNCKNNSCHRLFIQCHNCEKLLSSCCSISCKKKLKFYKKTIHKKIDYKNFKFITLK